MNTRAIRSVAVLALRDCYGVASGRVSDIMVKENKIYLTMKIWLKFGVTPEAVTESARDAIKYAIEQFTGMRLLVLNLNVAGIK